MQDKSKINEKPLIFKNNECVMVKVFNGNHFLIGIMDIKFIDAFCNDWESKVNSEIQGEYYGIHSN